MERMEDEERCWFYVGAGEDVPFGWVHVGHLRVEPEWLAVDWGAKMGEGDEGGRHAEEDVVSWGFGYGYSGMVWPTSTLFMPEFEDRLLGCVAWCTLD